MNFFRNTKPATTVSSVQVDKMLAMDDASFLRLMDNVVALPKTPVNEVTQRLVQIAAIRRLGGN